MASQNDTDENTRWLAVIGRSLAFLCLSEADLRAKELLPQATFLQALGLSRADAAAMLGSSDKSLAELARQAKNRKKANGKAKGKERR